MAWSTDFGKSELDKLYGPLPVWYHAGDFRGQRFNKLVAIKPIRLVGKEWRWIWKCDCGQIKMLRTADIKSGKTSSCGCTRKQKLTDRNKKDITGQVFGRLTAIKPLRINSHKKFVWLLKCECGNFKESTVSRLLAGECRSCGCMFIEMVTSTAKAKFEVARPLVNKAKKINHLFGFDTKKAFEFVQYKHELDEVQELAAQEQENECQQK